ncbi:MAG: SMR family transporter [Termitinemataceae bacterium]|jgi:multidrug transporter EmrE-like cation transporter|nr:MAG: SMR family transporter [Termitinemataceae bacterium]
MSYFLFAAYLLISLTGLMFLKQGSKYLSVSWTNPVLNLNIGAHLIIGCALYGVSFIISLFVMKRFDLSYYYPIAVGVGNVLVSLASMFVFKEHIPFFSWIGILLVCAGVALINFGKFSG